MVQLACWPWGEYPAQRMQHAMPCSPEAMPCCSAHLARAKARLPTKDARTQLGSHFGPLPRSDYEAMPETMVAPVAEAAPVAHASIVKAAAAAQKVGKGHAASKRKAAGA